LKFNYSQKPIYNIESLAKTLKIPKQELLDLVEHSNQLYVATERPKADGGIRVTYKAIKNLRPTLDALKLY